MSTLLPSASPRPFVSSGTAAVIPPVPVVVVAPVPVRLNQTSRVNDAAPRVLALPNVTY